MLFAWSSAQLETCCASTAQLRTAAGEQAAAAEDLLHLIAQAPTLADLGGLRSVRIGVRAGNLTLSMEDVDIHAHPLTPDGLAHPLASRASLLEHASSEALLVHDFHVRGRTILRLAS